MKTIAVIGAGTMGRGIAYAAALGGYRTVLEDVSSSMLKQGMDWIEQSFNEGVTRGKVEAGVRDAAFKQISTASTPEEAVREADLVIEAAPEDIKLKIELSHNRLSTGWIPSRARGVAIQGYRGWNWAVPSSR